MMEAVILGLATIGAAVLFVLFLGCVKAAYDAYERD